MSPLIPREQLEAARERHLRELAEASPANGSADRKRVRLPAANRCSTQCAHSPVFSGTRLDRRNPQEIAACVSQFILQRLRSCVPPALQTGADPLRARR
jgi:hypothetical protein